MWWPILIVLVYCSTITAASLFGGWLPARIRLTHTVMQSVMSFVGGLMLGVAVLHLIPHAAVELSLDSVVWWVLGGLLGTFLMMRWFHFHQHDHAHEEAPHDHGGQPCDEPNEHLMSHLSHSDQPHQLSWLGLFLGLAVHTLIDGIALAASVYVVKDEDPGEGLIGLATFLAILLHKPLDAFSIASVMVAAKWARSWIMLVNLLFALMCPLGAFLFIFGVHELATSQHEVVGAALGFSAGVFLCISLADILPEVQFHRHDRFKLSWALLAGVAVAVVIGVFEPEHAHSKPGSETEQVHDHGHDH